MSPTPSAHPVASSSKCTAFASITASPMKRDLSLEKMVKRVAEIAYPTITPAPTPRFT